LSAFELMMLRDKEILRLFLVFFVNQEKPTFPNI
jgi:hypothetical protein